MPISSLNDISPTLPNGEYWISSSANIIGDVRIGINVGIWFGAVLRGDNEPIIINEDTNIQENTVIHVDKGSMVNIGKGCTIGHSVIVHGCTIGDNSLIGMGSTLLNDSKIGATRRSSGVFSRLGNSHPEPNARFSNITGLIKS